MKINISGLSEGVHRYELVKSAVELGLASNLVGSVTATVTLEKSIHQILATVKASVKGVFVCDRCAEEYTDAVTTTYQAVYSWEPGAEQGEHDDDFHILGRDDHMIDVSHSVCEYLTLAVPVKLLCKNNCVLPVFNESTEETIDPRWEKLKNLKQSENK